MIHDLKCWREFFDAIERGDKTFEIRKDDRGFAVGDTLRLWRWCPHNATYVTRSDMTISAGAANERPRVSVRVTYKLPGGRFGLDPQWCVLGFVKESTNA